MASHHSPWGVGGDFQFVVLFTMHHGVEAIEG